MSGIASSIHLFLGNVATTVTLPGMDMGTHLLAGPSPSTVSQNSSFNPQNKPRGGAGTITASQMGKLSL